MLEGERKTVTALFADIKGSTELMEDLDPEEARAIVDPALKLMMDAVHRYDGYVVQSTGDGIFALFGAPVAHEDHPQRALYAALRMQEEMRRYAAEVARQKAAADLQVRVGVNTGEVVVRSIRPARADRVHADRAYTNLASRMQALAPTGSIAVSEATQQAGARLFPVQAAGADASQRRQRAGQRLRGDRPGPLRTRLQRAARRGLTRFVGREREMEALRRAAEQAQGGTWADRRGDGGAGGRQVAPVLRVQGNVASGWMVLETFSVSHGKASAYLPVIDLLHNYFRIASRGRRTQRAAKRSRQSARRSIAALEDTLPYLFSLLGIVEGDDPLAQMDAQIRKRRTLEAIKRILLRESLNQPLIVIFEDLHWIDEQTQELLNLLADSIGTAKILLLVNYRPEYSHQWGSKTYYTQLRLDPLGERERRGNALGAARRRPGSRRRSSG